jgi:hypothetical protein
MDTAARMAEMLSVFALYVHYHFLLVEGKNPSQEMRESGYLEPSLYIATAGAMMQMFGCVVGLLWKDGLVILSVLGCVCVFVGVAFVTLALKA